MASVYLIHFDKPLGNTDNPRGQAQHYIGYATKLKERIKRHKSGNGARIIAALKEQSIEWQVVRTWTPGTKALERALKNQKNAKRFCPICNQKQLTKS